MSRAAIRAPIRLDTELFSKDRKLDTTFTAFGMTRRPGRSTSNDPGLAALLDAKADAICFVAKSWDYHVRVALETTEEENLASIRDSVRAAKAKGREVLLDCEHFFDGYKANPDYALACAQAAYDAGARWVVLCDTNGGTLPHEVEEIVADVVKHIPGDHVGIHAHNDTEQAVANSLAAVRAGARQIQGTLNGIGERCGNANLVSIIPTLKLKPEFADRFDIGVSDEKLKGLAHISHALDEILNRAPEPPCALCRRERLRDQGRHSCLRDREGSGDLRAHRAGRGRQQAQGAVSDQAGRANVLAELDRIGLKVDKNDPRIMTLLDEVKEREAAGYAYESADASFELLARRTLGKVPDFFDVLQFDVNVEQRNNALGERVTVSMAVVKVKVDDQTLISAAEGNGPVNALDVALRKDLGKYQKYIDGLKLTDYRVRILNAGTEAVTRVLIESEDETGERWATIGVSPNIIDASFQALMDSIVYKLVSSRRAGVARPNKSRTASIANKIFALRKRRRCPLAVNATAVSRIETCASPRAFARSRRMRKTLRGRLVALQGKSQCIKQKVDPLRWRLRRCGRCRLLPAIYRRDRSTLRRAASISDRRKSMWGRATETGTAKRRMWCLVGPTCPGQPTCPATVRRRRPTRRKPTVRNTVCPAELMRRPMHPHPCTERRRSRSMAHGRPLGRAPTRRLMRRNTRRGRRQPCRTTAAAVVWSPTAA